MSADTAVNLALVTWLLASLVFLTFVEGFTVSKKIPTISARLQWLAEHVVLVRFLATVLTVALLIHFFFTGL